MNVRKREAVNNGTQNAQKSRKGGKDKEQTENQENNCIFINSINLLMRVVMVEKGPIPVFIIKIPRILSLAHTKDTPSQSETYFYLVTSTWLIESFLN